jgi:hypothetical protein
VYCGIMTQLKQLLVLRERMHEDSQTRLCFGADIYPDLACQDVTGYAVEFVVPLSGRCGHAVA